MKFRGQRLNGSEWIHGNLSISGTGNCRIQPVREGDWRLHVADSDYVKSRTVGQFTGFIKGEKEIYAGDIVEVQGTKRVGKYVTEIIWHGQGFQLKENKTMLHDHKAFTAIIRVIGNIYEHSDLLETSGAGQISS